MSRGRLKKYSLVIFSYMVLAFVFWLIGGNQLKEIGVKEEWGTNKSVIPEFSSGQKLEQPFVVDFDVIQSVGFTTATYGRENQGTIYLTIEDRNSGELLVEDTIDVAALKDNAEYIWEFKDPIMSSEGRLMNLTMSSDSELGEAPTLYFGDLANGQEPLILDGQVFSGGLHLVVEGINYSLFGSYYWTWIVVVGILLTMYMAWSHYQESRGKLTKGKLVLIIWKKYRFLIQQLVARDFKTKYKRSVLGYLWSFLNPLLTMLVQYLVFSTIFKSDIENYPVYLLSGIILFNFFSEAVGQGLGAIVYNASLITKVYVPKYIYPVTKVASTSINLFISIIPLLLVTVMTGVEITPAILLLPFVLFCLLMFCVGIVLMLSAAMVFFRDTQYLWGIISMIWMYATPLFYPENIIPVHLRFIQTFNPMYHMIKFARIIFIEGVSPEPMLYGTCLLSAIVMCVVGAIVFKRTQNKFILYI